MAYIKKIVIGGDASNYHFETEGPGIKDSITVGAIGGGGLTVLVESNSLTGYDGGDKLQVSGVHKGNYYEGVVVLENSLSTTTGKDKLSITASAKSGAVLVAENLIDSGMESDKIDIRATGAEVGTYVNQNTILAGATGKNSIKIEAKGKGYSYATATDLYADTVQIAQNSITAGKGDDRIDLKAVSKAGAADIYANNLYAGDGANRIGIAVQNKGLVADVLNTLTSEMNTYQVSAEIEGNAVVTGKDADRLDIKAKSGAGDANILDSFIDLGNGNNSLKITAQNKGAGGSQIADDVYEEYSLGYVTDRVAVFTSADISGSSITTGADKDTINLSAKSVAGNAVMESNTIDAGDGDNTLKFTVQNKGSEQTYEAARLDEGGTPVGEITGESIASFRGNEVLTGSGKDQITVSAKSAKSADIFDNTIEMGDGDNSLNLSANGGKGVSFVFGNELKGGDAGGDDRFNLTAKGGTASVSLNQIDTGYGFYDKVSLKATGREYAGASANSVNFDPALGYLSIDAKATGGDAVAAANFVTTYGYASEAFIGARTTGTDATAYASDNYLSGDYGAEFFGVIAGSKKGTAYASGNTLIGGEGDDFLSVIAYGGSSANIGHSDMEYYGNSIDGGDGMDFLLLSAESKKGEFGIAYNTLSGGMDDDFLSISAKGNSGNITDNLLVGGDGADFLLLEIDEKNASDAIQRTLENNSIDGGIDFDILSISSKKQTLSLDSVTGTNLSNIEQIDFGSAATLLIDTDDVTRITDGGNTLFVSGKGSTVDLRGGGFTYQGADGFYSLFTGGGATLYVDTAATTLI